MKTSIFKKCALGAAALMPLAGVGGIGLLAGQAGATTSTLTFNGSGVIQISIPTFGTVDVSMPQSGGTSVTGDVTSNNFTSGADLVFSGTVAASSTTFTVHAPSGAVTASDDPTVVGNGNVYTLQFSSATYAVLTGASSPYNGCTITNLGPVTFDSGAASGPYSLQADPVTTVLQQNGASGPQVTGSCTSKATLNSELQTGVSISTSTALEATLNPA